MRSILIILVLFISKLSAQSFEKGPEIKIGKDKFFDRIIGEDLNGFYEMRFDFKGNRKTYFLNQYNKTNLKKIRGIDVGEFFFEDEANYHDEGTVSYAKFISFICILKGRVYMFSKVFDWQNHLLQLVVDLYSTDNGEQLEKSTVLSEITSYGDNLYEKVFQVSLNHDSTKVLIVSHNSSQEKKQVSIAELYSLDGLKKIWSKQLLNEHNGNLIKARCCQIDSCNNLYYFFVYNSDSAKTSFNNLGLAYIPSKETKSHFLSLDLPKNISTYNPSMEYSSEDNAVYFLSNFKDSKNIEHRNSGVIYSKISAKTFSVEFSGYQYFSIKNKNEIECGKPSDDIVKQDFLPFKLIKINGEIFIYSNMDSHSMRNFILYHNSEVIAIFKLSPLGKPEWQTLVPRRTYFTYVTSNNDPTCLSVFSQEDKLCFLFVDDLNNKEITNDFNYCGIKPVGTVSGNNLTTISIDKNGVMNRKIIFLNDKEWVMPSNVILKANKDSYIMRHKAGVKESFVTLFIKP